MEKRILAAGDSSLFLKQIYTTLSCAGYDVITAQSGKETLTSVVSQPPSLLLLDAELKDINGFELCRQLRTYDLTSLMPIIMVSGSSDQETILKGLEVGADDFISKPYNERELLYRVNNTLRRINQNRMASPLTGLQGNLQIHEEINRRIENGRHFAVIYIDLDNFKAFNDHYGFYKGDLAIKLVADIMKNELKQNGNPTDFLGHIGGDDFVLITTPDKAEHICENVIKVFDREIIKLYSEKDKANKGILSKNRKGELEFFPIVSVSMGIITNEYRRFTAHQEVSTIASELHNKLKSMPGSNYYKDRRSAPFPPTS